MGSHKCHQCTDAKAARNALEAKDWVKICEDALYPVGNLFLGGTVRCRMVGNFRESGTQPGNHGNLRWEP